MSKAGGKGRQNIRAFIKYRYPRFPTTLTSNSRVSIVVSIPACHAGDPGSIPGHGVQSEYPFCMMPNAFCVRCTWQKLEIPHLKRRSAKPAILKRGPQTSKTC